MTDVKKKLRKRWGKKFKDTRDWPVYNGRLVKRGVYFLALDFVERWDEELAEMNRGGRSAGGLAQAALPGRGILPFCALFGIIESWQVIVLLCYFSRGPFFSSDVPNHYKPHNRRFSNQTIV